jgi:hypothetical protein
MMTYDVYAMFKEGSYKVAEGNNAEHAADFAERACKSIGQWPMAFATLIRGEHTINGKIFTFEDLKKRK